MLEKLLSPRKSGKACNLETHRYNLTLLYQKGGVDVTKSTTQSLLQKTKTKLKTKLRFKTKTTRRKKNTRQLKKTIKLTEMIL